ncbi:MAG TPA: DNA polymerase III subunit alpha, partial [Vicinamibacterales bacterium]|nr:DNA polymerase III subunit alpha [Vicinamibacterales bacterium]
LEQNDPKVKELLSVARRLEGMTRHASVHAAGVVIAPKAITEYAPLYKGARDEIVTQWTMKDVERMGLLKMDFLGLSTLTLIDDACGEIKKTEGHDLDIDHLPLDDEKTFKVFAEGATYGVFQFESSGMRELLRRAKPSRFDDLIALNALYRPGPLKSGMVDDWVERKQGKREVVYDLPQLESILSDSYGVIAYQEHVLRIAQAVAGFTLGQADVLRKAMGKKDPKVMAKQREAFVAGATAKGISEKKVIKLFEQIEFFAGYGFNKAHATAYALLAYRTAYLKAHYPWHFAAALLTIEAQNTDKLAMYLGECRDRGIPVLPPDVNESQLRFSVEKGKGVRFGLTAIKNVGEGAIESLLAVRAKQGHIETLSKLCEELDLRLVNKRVFESLAKAGAFDSLAAGDPRLASLPTREFRPKIFAGIDMACEHGARTQSDRERGQGGLFGELTGADRPDVVFSAMALSNVPAWSEADQLAFEKETLGLYWSGHPVDRFSKELKGIGARSTSELADAPIAAPTQDAWGPGGRRPIAADTTIGGVVAGTRPLRTKKGDRMAVFSLEDAQGSVKVIAFPETFQKSNGLIEDGRMVLVSGKLSRDEDMVEIVASEIVPIETVCERVAREVAIRVKGSLADVAPALREIFLRHRGDRRVLFEVETADHLRVRMDVSSQIRVHPSAALVAEVEQLVGHGAVELR